MEYLDLQFKKFEESFKAHHGRKPINKEIDAFFSGVFVGAQGFADREEGESEAMCGKQRVPLRVVHQQVNMALNKHSIKIEVVNGTGKLPRITKT